MHKHKKAKVKRDIVLPTNESKINLLHLALIISAVFLVYFNSLSGQFVWDDRLLIIDNKFIKDLRYVIKIFSADLFAGVEEAINFYRPVQTLSYIVDYFFWKLNTLGYHLTNIFLHSIAAVLVYCLIILFFENRKVALFTTLLYAVHPIHVEAVAYISGRADSLCAIFILASLITFIKFDALRHYLFSLVFFILALLSKEHALIFPVLLVVSQMVYEPKKKNFIYKIIPFLIIVFVYIFLRYATLNFLKGHESAILNIPLFNRALTFPKIIFIYLGLLFFPAQQHMERTVMIAQSVFEPLTILPILGLAILIIFMIRSLKRKQKIVFFGLSWFFINILPYSNIIVPVNALLSEHWVYIASVGFFLVVVNYLVKLQQFIEMSIFIPSLFIYSTATMLQNTYWANEFIQYKRVLTFSPNSARIHCNLGLAYAEKGCFEDAVTEFKKAIELNPGFIDSYINLGYTYQKKKLIEKAEEFFKEAIKVRPDSYLPYYYLANLYNEIGHFSEGIELYKKAINLNEKNPDIYFDLARAYDKNGNTDDAIKTYQKAIELDPLYTDVYLNLGSIFAENGQLDKAKAIWEKGLKYNPYNSDIKQNLEKLDKLQGRK